MWGRPIARDCSRVLVGAGRRPEPATRPRLKSSYAVCFASWLWRGVVVGIPREGVCPLGYLLPEERSRRRFGGVRPPRTECSTPTVSAVWMSLDVWIVGPELKRALVVRYHAD